MILGLINLVVGVVSLWLGLATGAAMFFVSGGMCLAVGIIAIAEAL